MLGDVEEVLITSEQIAQRVQQVAQVIVQDLAADPSHPAAGDTGVQGELTLVPILTGSFIFVADLIRHLPLRMQIRLISVSSYPDRSTSSTGAPHLGELNNLPDTFEDMHVLVIDDIQFLADDNGSPQSAN